MISANVKNGTVTSKCGTKYEIPVLTEQFSHLQENANKLAYEVGLQVYDLARGIGDKPQLPA